MKAFFFGILFLVLVGVGGFFYLSQNSEPKEATQLPKSAPITRTGMLQKSSLSNVDFTHRIVSGKDSWGVSSYAVNLDDYVGQNVEVTGQNSGTTLYADTVTVLPEP